jgi:hypothetical protein
VRLETSHPQPFYKKRRNNEPPRMKPRPRRTATAPIPPHRTAAMDDLMEQSRRIVFAVNPERESDEIMNRQL